MCKEVILEYISAETHFTNILTRWTFFMVNILPVSCLNDTNGLVTVV